MDHNLRSSAQRGGHTTVFVSYYFYSTLMCFQKEHTTINTT